MYSSDSDSNSNVFGGRFPPQHQAILEQQLGVLQVNSILTLPIQNIIRFHKLRGQSHKTVLCFWHQSQAQDWLADKSEVPMTLSLDSINLLTQLTELRKPVYSLDYLFIKKHTKDMNQQSDEEMHSVRSQTKELLSPWSVGPAA